MDLTRLIKSFLPIKKKVLTAARSILTYLQCQTLSKALKMSEKTPPTSTLRLQLNNSYQKQPPEVFCKKRCSYKFHKIHRKSPYCWRPFNCQEVSISGEICRKKVQVFQTPFQLVSALLKLRQIREILHDLERNR